MAFLDLRYFSPALEKQTSAWVLFPDTFSEPVSVIYLLHGLSDDHTIWLRRTALERYVEGLPLAVVMPDGGRSFYCDAVQGAPYATAIGEELVDRVDQLLPVRRDPGHRFVAGLSMGGYGAFRLALGAPERFGAAVSLSGALGFGHHYPAEDNTPFGTEFVRVAGNQPKGGPNDLYALARQRHREGNLPRLAFDCGADDFLIESNRDFARHLTENGIEHRYREDSGAHTWDYWDSHLPDVLRFIGFEPKP
jgi:putative tributyrin esterase